MVNWETRFIKDYAMPFAGDHRITSHTHARSQWGDSKRASSITIWKGGLIMTPPPFFHQWSHHSRVVVTVTHSKGGEGAVRTILLYGLDDIYSSISRNNTYWVQRGEYWVKKHFFFSFHYLNLRDFDGLISEEKKKIHSISHV